MLPFLVIGDFFSLDVLDLDLVTPFFSSVLLDESLSIIAPAFLLSCELGVLPLFDKELVSKSLVDYLMIFLPLFFFLFGLSDSES